MPSGNANQVRQYRLQRQWSQEELAKRAGVSRAAVSAVEQQRLTPSVQAAISLARVLGCTVAVRQFRYHRSSHRLGVVSLAYLSLLGGGSSGPPLAISSRANERRPASIGRPLERQATASA